MIDLTVILTAKDLNCVPELRELLAMQVNLSRLEPGCVRFEAFESQTLAGTFILIERWGISSRPRRASHGRRIYDNLCTASAASGKQDAQRLSCSGGNLHL